jgi:hypothetical protein
VSRGSPLVRQWILIKTLASRAGGATLAELAEELEVCSKTIRRDLTVLLDSGFPVQEESREFGRKLWRLDPSWPKTDLSFTFDEALALYLGRQYLEPLAGTLIWEAAQRAFKKIRASLGRHALKYLERMLPSLPATAFGIADYSRRAEVIDNLMVGIEDRRVVFITYRSQRSTEPVTYDIHPYRIVRHRGSLYVHGHKPDDAISGRGKSTGSSRRTWTRSASRCRRRATSTGTWPARWACTMAATRSRPASGFPLRWLATSRRATGTPASAWRRSPTAACWPNSNCRPPRS